MRRLADSVRVRITAAVALIFGIALSLAAVGLVRQVESALISDLEVRNDTVTHALAGLLRTGQVSPELFRGSSGEVERRLSGDYDPEVLHEGITESYIYATGPAVGVMDDSNSLLDRFRRVITGEATPLFGKVMPTTVSPDRFAISQATVQTPSGQLVLTVASPLVGIQRTVHEVSNALLVAVPSLVVLVGLMTWFMTGRALRPVLSITNRVKEITGSTLHERVPEPHTDDEIGDLARMMNEMLDRLEGAAARQKRFMSDASHELRSPVASIRTQLETALLDGERTDWEAVARTVLAEDERLESLVGNMLLMARIEEGVRPPVVEVDLDEVVLEQAARPTRVVVDRSAVLAGRVMGVPQELTSVVRNLLDNAVRHASTRVKVSVDVRGPVVRLAVEDDGPGVAPADREKVFERFARLQEGRSRDAGGSGLGLALTRRIVDAHGGRVFVESSTLGGASFVVELPVAAEDESVEAPVDVEVEVGVDEAGV